LDIAWNCCGNLIAQNTGSLGAWGGSVYSLEITDGYDATGTSVVYFNPALYVSGSTFTASTGEVWTINGGAHIVTRTGLYFDGSNDYLKTAAMSLSQPESVYFVGEQVTWTSNDKIYDGNGASERMAMLQYTGGATPQLAWFAGTTAGPYTTWAVKTVASVLGLFNGASGYFRVNRVAADAASVNTNPGNGLTVGAAYDGSANGNIFVSELAIYSVAHDQATQDRLALGFSRKWRFTV